MCKRKYKQEATQWWKHKLIHTCRPTKPNHQPSPSQTGTDTDARVHLRKRTPYPALLHWWTRLTDTHIAIYTPPRAITIHPRITK